MNDCDPSQVFEKASDLVEQGYRRGDLNGLQSFSRDLTEMASGLTKKDQQELDELLLGRFGRPLRDRFAQKTMIDGVLKRGAIADEEEYRLLMSRMDEIYSDTSKGREIERINALLAAHHSAGSCKK